MKTHGPNSPQSIRGLRDRRSQRGLLDTRRMTESDLRAGEMISPFGKGFFKVKNPGGGSDYIVADQTGGRTFAPGSTVVLGSYTGLPGEAVLGGAPAGKKGGGARTRNPRRRGTAAAAANQYAFGGDGVDLYAMLYADGTYVSTRATISEFGTTPCGCILEDSSEILGDGSLLMSGGGSHYVWDVESASTYSYAIPSGWTNATNVYYQNGYLYWVEFEDIPTGGIGVGDATFDYRLRRSATDLSGVSTLLTVTSANANSYGVPYTIYDDAPEPIAFAVDTDGAVLYMGYFVSESINHEDTEWHGLQVRFALSGSSANRAFTTPEMAVDGFGTSVGPYHAVTLGGTSYAIAAVDNGVSSVVSKGDNASAGPSNLWGASDLDDVLVAALSLGTGGSVIQAYSALGIIVRGIASGVVITSSVDAFAAGPTYPSAMYYFGE